MSWDEPEGPVVARPLLPAYSRPLHPGVPENRSGLLLCKCIKCICGHRQIQLFLGWPDRAAFEVRADWGLETEYIIWTYGHDGVNMHQTYCNNYISTFTCDYLDHINEVVTYSNCEKCVRISINLCMLLLQLNTMHKFAFWAFRTKFIHTLTSHE